MTADPSPLGRLLDHLVGVLPPPTPEEAARINAWWERMDGRRRRRLAESAEEIR